MFLVAGQYIAKYFARESLLNTMNSVAARQAYPEKVTLDLSMLSNQLKAESKFSELLSRGFRIEKGQLYLKERGWIFDLEVKENFSILCLVQLGSNWSIYCMQLAKELEERSTLRSSRPPQAGGG